MEKQVLYMNCSLGKKAHYCPMPYIYCSYNGFMYNVGHFKTKKFC
jgi:hypothetical protein